MIIQEEIKTGDIVKISDVTNAYGLDLMLFYEKAENKKTVIDMEDGTFATYEGCTTGIDTQDIRVAYGADMYKDAYRVITRNGYDRAIAVAEDGKYVTFLRNEPSTYVHQYKSSGFLDVWFLNEYDCVFLHDCNEYSIVLLQETLMEWNGFRIVLVGDRWEPMLPYLVFPEKEIHYESTLTAESMGALTKDVNNSLQIIVGYPHNEPLDRLADGIMYYDEIMALSYMFADYRSMGPRNADKKFFVVDGRYGNLGLFALLDSVKHVIRYVKSRGFIPVVELTKSNNSFYSDCYGDDIWGKFFNQPSDYSMDEVMESQNVYRAPGFYNGRVMNYIMDAVIEEAEKNNNALDRIHISYNDEVCAYVEERMKKYLPCPEKTLGVLARGTDYVNTHLANHPRHASVEQICEKIDEILAEHKELEYIYLATEDASYCEFFAARYGERVSYTDQVRYTVKAGEMLSELHRRTKKSRKGFDYGAEYVASITLLSKCARLIASGSCAGVGEAIRMNSGNYKEVYVFELGTNPA